MNQLLTYLCNNTLLSLSGFFLAVSLHAHSFNHIHVCIRYFIFKKELLQQAQRIHFFNVVETLILLIVVTIAIQWCCGNMKLCQFDLTWQVQIGVSVEPNHKCRISRRYILYCKKPYTSYSDAHVTLLICKLSCVSWRAVLTSD